MGHLGRCINLARELERRGTSVGFLINDDESAKARVSASGFDYSVCAIDDSAGVKKCGNAVVLDTKEDVGARVAQLKESGRRVFVIENLTAVDDSDAVIIPAPVFEGKAVPRKVFAGARYVIMGDNFKKVRPKRMAHYTVPLRVLVTMGGADPNHLTRLVTDVLKDVPGIEVTVVIGPAASVAPAELERLVEGAATPFTFVTGTDDLAPYMKRAHIAFTAVGTTVYELAYMGVPSVVIANYESDETYMEVFAAMGISESLGYYGNVRGRDIVEAVRNFIKDPSMWKAMSRSCAVMTDGRGASRIADVIETVCSASAGAKAAAS